MKVPATHRQRQELARRPIFAREVARSSVQVTKLKLSEFPTKIKTWPYLGSGPKPRPLEGSSCWYLTESMNKYCYQRFTELSLWKYLQPTGRDKNLHPGPSLQGKLRGLRSRSLRSQNFPQNVKVFFRWEFIKMFNWIFQGRIHKMHPHPDSASGQSLAKWPGLKKNISFIKYHDANKVPA